MQTRHWYAKSKLQQEAGARENILTILLGLMSTLPFEKAVAETATKTNTSPEEVRMQYERSGISPTNAPSSLPNTVIVSGFGNDDIQLHKGKNTTAPYETVFHGLRFYITKISGSTVPSWWLTIGWDGGTLWTGRSPSLSGKYIRYKGSQEKPDEITVSIPTK